MERIVRAVPIKSKQALQDLARQIEEWPEDEKSRFLEPFGNAAEDWFYQEIDGKPFVLAVVDGESLSEGFAEYPECQDPFFCWFHKQVLELSGVDLREVPTAAPSEFVFRLGG